MEEALKMASRIAGNANDVQGLTQRADLVGFDQDAVCRAMANAFLQSLFIGNEEIVSDKHDLRSELFRQRSPAFKIPLIQAILD